MHKSPKGDYEEWERDLLTLRSKSIKKIDASASLGVHRGREVVLKVFGNGKEVLWDFAYETQVHQWLCRTIPDKVPALLKAYVLKKGNTFRGVHIMERLPGVLLEKLVPHFGTQKSVDLAQMATHLKRLFDALKKSRVYHGDLHAQNIFVDLDKRGNVRNIQVIDFGNSIMDVDIGNENLYAFLDTYLDYPKLELLIPYLRKAGLDVADDILDWDQERFEEDIKYRGILRETIIDEDPGKGDISRHEVVEDFA